MSVDKAKLTEPFPKSAIKQRKGGGGRMFDYVEGHTVIHRLNDATDNCWDMEVKSIESKQVGPSTLMIARVALTIPTLGTRESLGVQLVNEAGGEDLVKGCITDALKKAATLFGVGLELYGPDYEAGEVSAPATSERARQSVGVVRNNPVPTREPRDTPGARPPDALIDKRGVVYLWTMAGTKGIEDAPDEGDKLHQHILKNYGKTSTKDLTRIEARYTLEWLQSLPDKQPVAAGQQGMNGMPEEPTHLRDYTAGP